MEENQLFMPDGWAKQKGDNLFKVQGGYAFKSNDYKDEGVLLVRISNVGNNNFIYKDLIYVPKRFLTSHSNFLLDKDDVLMGLTGDLGKICILENGEFPFILNQRVGRFIFNEKVSNRFLYYLISSSTIQNKFDAFFTGGAQKNISPKQIESVEYVFPKSTTEQTAIATILSKTDQAIANTEALIAKYTKIKTGLMQDLLTKGIDENGNIRSEQTHEFKDSPLGRIPKEWESLTIKDIAERLRSGVTPKGGSDVYEKEGILLIRSQNVYSYGFKLDDVAYINEEINNSMLGSQLKKFDVLLNITGASIGRATYVPEGFPRANVNQHVCAIRLKKADVNNAIFLSSYLNSIYGQNQIYQNIAGSNREGINYTQIKEIKVPFFNNDFELEKFSEMVIKSNERINSEMNKLTKLQSLKTGLMQDLLSGKVRVKVSEL